MAHTDTGDTMITRRLLSNTLAEQLQRLFFESLQPRTRSTDAGSKRPMIFFSPDGMVPSLWRPPTNGSCFEILPNQILALLQPHQDDFKRP